MGQAVLYGNHRRSGEPGRMLVAKKSGKAFKSGRRVNTVTGTTTNPHTDKPAYTFAEDDSVVDIQTCKEMAPDDPWVVMQLAKISQ